MTASISAPSSSTATRRTGLTSGGGFSSGIFTYEDPGQFAVLHKYSPYHRVKKGEKYPATLFITGDADTRVDPLHARKMTALLQSATGSDKPVLLRYETKAGHSGRRPVSKVVEDLTNEMRFLFWQLGVSEVPAASTPK